MKKFIFLAMFAMISATAFAQFPQINTRTQIFNNTPTYNSGGYQKLVLNSGTNRLEATPNTLLSGKVVAVTEKDSARNYTCTGSFVTYIKWASRDTIQLANTSYFSSQILRFTVIASGADTTVFIPASGTIDASANYTLTGTRNSITLWYDGTNYWIIK